MIGNRNIFLVGPMGSGKTAVGRQLARMLRTPFVDSDAEVEARTGAEIALIFEKEGEAGFREREREVIDELTQREPVVLSTGGGAILHPRNRECLGARGAVVYLQTSVAQQASRVRSGRQRPLLAGVDPAAKLAELMAIRAPLYTATADVIVPTDDRKVKTVAECILRELRARGWESRSDVTASRA
ncbi:MAG: shikimate kinase AroK [Steroidobacteraceae bacterium]|jgi:shikimate kinase|nr:shikimate kinase AroK [Steroidobacteraceae bacterium]